MTRRRRGLQGFRNDDRGVAAVELALIGSLFVGAVLNVADVAHYALVTTQVAVASQAAAQASVATCDTTETPVTINCADVAAAVTTAIRGTSLGSAVTLQGGLNEGWYCLNAANTLQYVAAPASKPSNCIAVNDPGSAPALYLRVQAAYAYQPIFPGLTVAAAFPGQIVRTAWMRLL
ncbi:TadE/TadG family type IV pilus assembly protein [Phenylobacterium sp.]|uniref:TadE/TadG family type IV pilus assembly protein n=1 Tax=Phenylobacterium sp. TaxID=1871053 RepID=UPI00398333B5